MDYLCKKDDFDKIVKDHVVKIFLDNGIYRHLKCTKPGTIVNSFNIVTSPYNLFYYGDMGSFSFLRTEDMFEFFRGETITPDYWASKLTSTDIHGSHKQFSNNDFLEYDRSVFTYRFIFCCYAIVWAIQQYDVGNTFRAGNSNG